MRKRSFGLALTLLVACCLVGTSPAVARKQRRKVKSPGTPELAKAILRGREVVGEEQHNAGVDANAPGCVNQTLLVDRWDYHISVSKRSNGDAGRYIRLQLYGRALRDGTVKKAKLLFIEGVPSPGNDARWNERTKEITICYHKSRFEGMVRLLQESQSINCVYSRNEERDTEYASVYGIGRMFR